MPRTLGLLIVSLRKKNNMREFNNPDDGGYMNVTEVHIWKWQAVVLHDLH